MCDRYASLLTPFPTLNLVLNMQTRLHVDQANKNSELWLESTFFRTWFAAERRASSVLVLVDKTGSLQKCCFPPPPLHLKLWGRVAAPVVGWWKFQLWLVEGRGTHWTSTLVVSFFMLETGSKNVRAGVMIYGVIKVRDVRLEMKCVMEGKENTPTYVRLT